MATGCRLFVIPAARLFIGNNVFFMSFCSARTVEACEPSFPPGRAKEESRNVRVWAWWDFKNCHLPSAFDATKVAPTIMEAVRANGIKGPLNITAFGDVQLLPRPHQEALTYTGVRFTHVSNDGRTSADILVDLMYWVSQNPPPAHIFLISGDRDFAGVLHRLRMTNYNILLATPDKEPSVLHSAATIAWHWSSLLHKENLTGQHFNHPPDGPFGSWYGSYKPSCLEKPVLVQPNVEVYEPSPSPSPSPSSATVLKSVVSQVRHILSLHPEGINITALRTELAKRDVRLDRSVLGHKKFSRFLLSLPCVQLRPAADGHLIVHLVPSESQEPCEISSVASTMSGIKNEEKRCAVTPKINGEDKNMVRDADEKSSIASVLERNLDDNLKSVQPGPSQGRFNEEYVDGGESSPSPVLVERHVCQPPNELRTSSVAFDKVEDVANAQRSETHLPPKDNKNSKTKMDSLKVMTSQKSSGEDIVRSGDAGHKSMEKHTTPENHSVGNDQSMVENIIPNYESGNFKVKNKCESRTRKEVDEGFHSLSSSPVDGSQVVQTAGGSAETNNRSPKWFHWIRGWWPFGKSNAKYDDSTAHQKKVVSQVEDSKLSELDQTVSRFEEPKLSELDLNVSHVDDSKLSELDQAVSQFEEPKLTEVDQNVSHSGKPELFSSASFWNDTESFIFAPEGSLIFSWSRSREDVVHKLQNSGPLVLRSLPKEDILQLVELLITEKKWLEESPSQTFPFKLIRPVQKNSLLDQSHGANALRSLFIGKTSQLNLKKSLEHDVVKHNQSFSHAQVSVPAAETKYTERSRNDILEDCWKLVSEILREHPEGYNIGSFRRQFVDRYGYHLDIQKLGYQKLAALLQIMPGVKLESTYIFPSVPAVCDSDLETSILKTQATTDSHVASSSDSELSESTLKDDKMESPWQELGPVSFTNSNKSDLESKSSQKAIELNTSKSKHPDYEPAVSDDEFSASEGDGSCLTQSVEQRKPKCNELDSSFWQALDLWHSNKEGENNVERPDNVDSWGASLMDSLDSSTDSTSDTVSKIPSSNYRENSVKKSDNVDSLADIFNSSNELTKGTLSKPSSNYREKQRSHKNYSFVADPVLPNKD